MRWSTGDRSNINDMRGSSGGGGRMIPLGIGGFVVVALLSTFTGVDFFSILGGGGGPQPTAVGTSGTPRIKLTPGACQEYNWIQQKSKWHPNLLRSTTVPWRTRPLKPCGKRTPWA